MTHTKLQQQIYSHHKPQTSRWWKSSWCFLTSRSHAPAESSMAPGHMGSCIPTTAATALSAALEPSLRKTFASWSETHSPRGSSGPQTHADLENQNESVRKSKNKSRKQLLITNALKTERRMKVGLFWLTELKPSEKDKREHTVNTSRKSKTLLALVSIQVLHCELLRKTAPIGH